MTDSEIVTAIANVATGQPNTAEEIRNLFTELFSRCAKSKTVILKDVTNQYIMDNFDGTGLGINLEVGYAMCNGNNGTRNWAERVPVAYGGTMLTMGESLGEKTHTLTLAEMPAHSHSVAEYAGSTTGSAHISAPVTSGLQGTSTGSQGGDEAHNNMQPYIVTLALMKI